MNQIHRLLVANRGEIAIRIMKTAKKMGIYVIAIYSEVDQESPHVHFADEAYLIGPAPALQSYLNMDKILSVASESKADAIHPGYGFLSENAHFAKRVRDAGLIFVGPTPEAIEIMGDKLSAKQAVKAYGVPLVPGLDRPVRELEEAKRIASAIGYPVLIKASAGGGGKGMRIVENEAEFEAQMDRAVSEARSAFGNPEVFVEKYISSPRHIEIQVLADSLGNTLYLFERECSIQRRHQKVIEEAPSVIVNQEMRESMGEAAIKVCQACDYLNAGTVEFIVDAGMNFYFLEMNTRLQVEHPVTEMITGVDLVGDRISNTEGHPISFRQENLKIDGHAIEIRVYAEDPSNKFLPDTGRLQVYRTPAGEGIRVDDGAREGMDIPVYYDPMLAKLIVHASERKVVIDKMLQAIQEYEIYGVETTLAFCRFVLEHPAFRSGDFDTHFVSNYFDPDLLQVPPDDEEALIASLLAEQLVHDENSRHQQFFTPPLSPWKINRS